MKSADRNLSKKKLMILKKLLGDNTKRAFIPGNIRFFSKRFRRGTIRAGKSVKKDADVVKTAKADSKFYRQKVMHEKNQDIVERHKEVLVRPNPVSEERC